jgi:hypothetical protein
MKTNHKKTPSSAGGVSNLGNNPFANNGIMGIFKFNRTIQDQAVKSYAPAGFTRIEKEEALILEAEARRNQGRVYANITPIR